MGMLDWILLMILFVFFIKPFLPVKGITNLSVQETKDKLKDQQVQFVDVRTPGEYKANHEKPFKNIPLSKLPNKIDALDKEKEVVIICQSGMRSAKAAKLLKKQGFQKIYNVKGDMNAWR